MDYADKINYWQDCWFIGHGEKEDKTADGFKVRPLQFKINSEVIKASGGVSEETVKILTKITEFAVEQGIKVSTDEVGTVVCKIFDAFKPEINKLLVPKITEWLNNLADDVKYFGNDIDQFYAIALGDLACTNIHEWEAYENHVVTPFRLDKFIMGQVKIAPLLIDEGAYNDLSPNPDQGVDKSIQLSPIPAVYNFIGEENFNKIREQEAHANATLGWHVRGFDWDDGSPDDLLFEIRLDPVALAEKYQMGINGNYDPVTFVVLTHNTKPGNGAFYKHTIIMEPAVPNS